jgi:hypothetical protein
MGIRAATRGCPVGGACSWSGRSTRRPRHRASRKTRPAALIFPVSSSSKGAGREQRPAARGALGHDDRLALVAAGDQDARAARTEDGRQPGRPGARRPRRRPGAHQPRRRIEAEADRARLIAVAAAQLRTPARTLWRDHRRRPLRRGGRRRPPRVARRASVY